MRHRNMRVLTVAARRVAAVMGSQGVPAKGVPDAAARAVLAVAGATVEARARVWAQWAMVAVLVATVFGGFALLGFGWARFGGLAALMLAAHYMSIGWQLNRVAVALGGRDPS